MRDVWTVGASNMFSGTTDDNCMYECTTVLSKWGHRLRLVVRGPHKIYELDQLLVVLSYLIGACGMVSCTAS